MEISSTLSNMGLWEEEGINKLGGQSPTCEGWGSSLDPFSRPEGSAFYRRGERWGETPISGVLCGEVTGYRQLEVSISGRKMEAFWSLGHSSGGPHRAGSGRRQQHSSEGGEQSSRYWEREGVKVLSTEDKRGRSRWEKPLGIIPASKQPNRTSSQSFPEELSGWDPSQFGVQYGRGALCLQS